MIIPCGPSFFLPKSYLPFQITEYRFSGDAPQRFYHFRCNTSQFLLVFREITHRRGAEYFLKETRPCKKMCYVNLFRRDVG